MKKVFITLSTVLMFAGFFAQAERLPTKDVIIGVNSAHVPGGFDSNSDVYVIVSGIFPNSCYNWKEANIAMDKTENEITVTSVASVTQGICLMVLVPFTKEVYIGQLDAGDYTLRFPSADGTYFEKSLHIEE